MASRKRKPWIGFGIMMFIIIMPFLLVEDVPFRPMLTSVIVLSQLSVITITGVGWRLANYRLRRELRLLHLAAIFTMCIPYFIATLFDLYNPYLATYLCMFGLYATNQIYRNSRAANMRG
jgi:hypothetical protein